MPLYCRITLCLRRQESNIVLSNVQTCVFPVSLIYLIFAALRPLATSNLCGEKAFKNKTKVQRLVSCVCPMQYKGYLNPVRCVIFFKAKSFEHIACIPAFTLNYFCVCCRCVCVRAVN